MSILDADQSSVLFLVLLIWAVVIATCLFAARHDRRAPADDIGVLWLVVLGMYSTFSPLSWLLQDGSYSFLSLYRLISLQPTVDEITQLLNIALAYISGFAATYLLLRRYVPPGVATTHGHVSTSNMTAAFGIVVAFQATMLVMRLGGVIRTPDSYYDSYLVVQELPLALRQVLKIAGGIASVAMLVLLVGILQRWPRQRFLFVLYIAMILLSFDPKGARTGIAIGLLSAGVAWHVLVRPIPLRWWLITSILGLVLFTVFGIIRALEAESFADLRELSTEGIGLGEFDALWANAVELLQARESGWLDVPAAARFGELWAFIPSQLLPFEKMSLSEWFVETFYPSYQAAGGGWAFGAVSQAVIGGGTIEAALRGAVLGALAAWVMKWYRSPAASWWRFPLYLYLLIFVYLSVRDTTFTQIGYVVQIALPALILIALIGKLLAIGSNAARPAGGACRTSPLITHI
jgi:hypothetical protein